MSRTVSARSFMALLIPPTGPGWRDPGEREPRGALGWRGGNRRTIPPNVGLFSLLRRSEKPDYPPVRSPQNPFSLRETPISLTLVGDGVSRPVPSCAGRTRRTRVRTGASAALTSLQAGSRPPARHWGGSVSQAVTAHTARCDETL